MSIASSNSFAFVRRGLRAFVWYLKGVVGEDAYEQYLRYHRSTGCRSAPMSEKAFWADKMDSQDRNPQGRCC